MDLLEQRTTKCTLRSSSRARSLVSCLKRIKGYPGLQKNRLFILDYERQCEVNGNKVATRLTSMELLHHLQQYAGNRDFKSLAREDIIEFLDLKKQGKFEDTRFKRKHGRPTRDVIADSTMNLRRQLIRKFFAFVHDYRKGYPPVVDWMKVTKIGRDPSRRIDPSDLLTPEEIYTIISHAESPRDKALLSFLAESGCRAGEASTLRVKDVAFTERGIEVKVTGKTGPRMIPLVVSKPDLENWLNNFHLFASESDSPLFPRLTMKQQPLNLHTSGIWNVVKKTVARASIMRDSLRTKKVSPHSFRHARATELARLGWTEAMLRVYFGWRDDSTMPTIYIHLSQSDVAKRYYRMYGKVEEDKEIAPRLEENSPCPMCGIRNPTGYLTCFSCHMPINKADTELRKDKQQTVDTLNFIAKDKELSGKLLQLIEEANKKQNTIQEESKAVPVN